MPPDSPLQPSGPAAAIAPNQAPRLFESQQPPAPAKPAPAPAGRPGQPTAFQYAEMTVGERVAHDRAVNDFDRRQSLGPQTVDAYNDTNRAAAATMRNTDSAAPTQNRAMSPLAPATAPLPGDDQLVKIGDLELPASSWRDLAAQKAEADLHKAQIPATAADYKLDLPADLKLPDGVQVKFSADDPVLGPQLDAVREWAHLKNLSQSDFSELLGLYAATTAHEHTVIANAANAERAKLGVSGPARIDAISLWLRGTFGDAAARPVLATLCTATHVEVFEKIISKIVGQGSANFSQQHRDASGGGGMTDERWATMSFAEKQQWQGAGSEHGRRR